MMETRIPRLHSSSSSLSRSCSPISDNEKRSITPSSLSRRGPSTPIKSSIQRNDSDEEQEQNEREILTFHDDSKVIVDETSSPMMSDTEENHQKKRSNHRHHHHRHNKQSKSNKRSATTHHRHSVKRSKKETITTTRRQKSNDENSLSTSEKNTSESEQSQSEKNILSPSSSDEEGIIEGNNTSNEHRTRRHRKKQRHSSSSNNERNSPNLQSSSISLPKNNKGTQLIVNYLPASLRESDFYQLFARIAPVKLCKLITDRHTGHSYCYGFIEYHSKEDAIKAIEKFNGYRIEHKKLKVSYAQPKSNNNDDLDTNTKHTISSSSSSSSIQKNSNIYITDLPDDFDEKMLERLFSKYGEIIQTKILRDPRTRISRGVGFVLMTSTRYAERAVKALDGYVPSGSHTPISVKYADPKKTTTSNNESNNSPSHLSRTSSMVASIGPYGYQPGMPPFNMIDPYYAAALHHHHRAAMTMRDLSPSPSPFYSSGNSRSSRIHGSSPDLPRSYSSSKHSSNTLTTSLNSPSSRSSNINSSLLNNHNTPSSLAAACELISKGCQQAIDPNGFVIYAFGLPHDCDENDLEELFRRYGEVYRVYIVRNYSTGESKGYSFVTMRNYNEACHAVDRLDGSTFKGRTIQVRFKQ